MAFREPEKRIFLSYSSYEASTLDGHNFLFQTPIRVFLDYMESPLSLEYIHIQLNAI